MCIESNRKNHINPEGHSACNANSHIRTVFCCNQPAFLELISH